MDRDEMVKQLDRWTEISGEEAIILFVNLSARQLMSTAITITDARLAKRGGRGEPRARPGDAGTIRRRRPS
jgi:EAL domain-containing protein (putative c-di-GMP-specific phosphodiesterase class I)